VSGLPVATGVGRGVDPESVSGLLVNGIHILYCSCFSRERRVQARMVIRPTPALILAYCAEYLPIISGSEE
jgi:hypothetical protein